MKKIITLMFVFAICILAIAGVRKGQPVAIDKAKTFTPVKFQKKSVEKVQSKKVAKFASKQQAVPLKQAASPLMKKAITQTLSKKEKALLKLKQAKQPKAAAEVFEAISCSGIYYASSCDIQYTMVFGPGYEAYFDILLPEGQKDVTIGKTYTFEDMDPYYSWIKYNSASGADFSTATFVKNATADAGIYSYKGTFTTTSGEEYEITFTDEPLPVATDTIDVNIPEAELNNLISSQGILQMLGYTADEKQFSSIALYTDQITGTYTSDDMMSAYTYVITDTDDEESKVNAKALDATISTIAGYDKPAYKCEAYMLGADAHCYHVTFTYIQPDVKTEDVTAVEYSGTYYEEDGDWYGKLTVDDDNYFRFDILTGEGATFPVADKTYTLDDMLSNYTYAYINGEKVNCVDATFTYSKDEQTGKEKIVAQMICNNFVNYNITYTTPERPTEFTDVPVTMTKVKIYDFCQTEGAFQVVGVNEDGDEAAIALRSNQIPGTYTLEDIYDELDEYNYIYIAGKQKKLCDVEATITATQPEGSYAITANLYSFDGNKYIVNMDYIIPQVKDTIDVVCTDLEIQPISFWGFILGYYLSASNDDYSLALDIMDEETGVYDDLLVLTDKATGNEINLFKSTIDVESSSLATGNAIDTDGHFYNFDLSFSIPEPTDTIDINVVTGGFDDLIADMGAFQIVGFDADSTHVVSLVFYNDQLAGNYTEADIDASYTYIGKLDATKTVLEKEWDVKTITATVTTNSDGTINCVAEARAKDIDDSSSFPLFNINIENLAVNPLKYDAEDEGFFEQFTEYTQDEEYMQSYGEVYVDANNDNNATISLGFYVDPQEGLVSGEYPITNTGEIGTVMASTGVDEYYGYVYPSFAGFTDEEDYITIPMWFCVNGKVKIDGDMNIIVDAVNSYGMPIQVTLPSGATGIDTIKDNQNLKNINRKAIVDNKIVITKNSHKFNTMGIELKK